jgi:hypothetical protein
MLKKVRIKFLAIYALRKPQFCSAQSTVTAVSTSIIDMIDVHPTQYFMLYFQSDFVPLRIGFNNGYRVFPGGKAAGAWC